MIILWTDALLWLIVMIGGGMAWRMTRRGAVKARWRQVFASPLAITAFVVLMGYVFLGLLDSMHFYHQHSPSQPPRVVSVLDTCTGYLGEKMEASYSEPLALRAFSESMSMDSKRPSVWAKQPLRYVNPSIADDHARNKRVRQSLMMAFLGGLLFCLGLRKWMHNHNRKQVDVSPGVLKTQLAWWGTLSLMFFTVLTVVLLAQDFHVLGTDQVGLDVLYKVIKSIRTALIIGTLTTLLILPFALFLGCSAGYFGGWVDDLVQYVYTTISAIPSALLIAAMVLSLHVYMAGHPEGFGSMVEQADTRLLFLCAILGLTSWTGLCRMLRGETLKLRELEFVQSARALGSSSWRIIVRHIFPNVMHLVLIALVLDFSQLILYEAILSYIGVGVDPSTLSWGTLINSARMELAREPVVWWPLLSTFVSMLGLVLAMNLFAESVRDAFDPHGHSHSND